MTYTVPPRPNTRAMLYAALETDTALVAMLGDGADSILPRNNHDPAKAKKCFLLVRLEGTGSLGDDNLDRTTWVIEVHDAPGKGLVHIDGIIAHLKRRLHGARWSTPTGSIERPRRLEWLSASGELPDEGYSTIKRIARFALFGS